MKNTRFENRLIDEEQPALTTRASYGWKQYHTIDEIYDWLDQMTRRYPRELTNYNIGKTHEKRNIRAVKLSYNPERVCLFEFFIQQMAITFFNFSNIFMAEKSNNLHRVHHSCSRMDYSCNSHVHSKRTVDFKRSRCARNGHQI